MQVLRRSVVALCAASAIFALVGCGGLGVNLGSGSGRGSQIVSRVNIQVQSGINIPTVTVNHPILMTAVACYLNGSTCYVSSTQGAVWGVILEPPPPPGGACGGVVGYSCTTNAAFTGETVLFNGDCFTPYTGTVTQTICVLGTEIGTTGLTATVSGITGQVTVTVQ
ncbi:MAG TPA: hypothetical protein VIX35_01945 [Vicinamibacterales bacterium]